MELSVRTGSFAYNHSLLWKDVSFDVKDGEILAIMGPNGVGKTTLLRCIMNLLPFKTGGAYLDNQPVKELPLREFWQKIAYVPQAKKAPSFTVKDFVLMGRNVYVGSFGKPSKLDEQKALEAMTVVGVADLAHKTCQELSGGQFQMILVARALCAEPKCLILDEPESNLDFRNQLLVLQLMERLAKEHQIACIFNTHYPEHGLKIADKTVLVYKNEPAVTGKTKEVVNKENLERLFKVKVDIAEQPYEDGYYQTIMALELLKGENE
jgi:iron complex transport system ATP-binding protein